MEILSSKETYRGVDLWLFKLLDVVLITSLLLFIVVIMLIGAFKLDVLLLMTGLLTICFLWIRVRRIMAGQCFTFYEDRFVHNINDKTLEIKYVDIEDISAVYFSKVPKIITISAKNKRPLTVSRLENMSALLEKLTKLSTNIVNKNRGKQHRQKLFIYGVVITLTASISLLIAGSSFYYNSFFLLLAAFFLFVLFYFVLNQLYKFGTEAIPYIIGLLPLALYSPYNEFLYDKCKTHFDDFCAAAVERIYFSSDFSEHVNDIKSLDDKDMEIIHLLERGCNVGHKRSCYLTSLAYLNIGDNKKLFSYALESCNLKYKVGCFYVARLYGTAKDEHKSLHFLTIAFELGYDNFDIVENESSFDFIRDSDKYKALIKKYQRR